MAEKEKLKEKHDEIVSQFEDVKGSVTLVSIIVGVLVLSGIAILVLKSPPLNWIGFGENDIGTGVGVTILIVIVLTGIFTPVLLVSHLMDAGWNNYYREAWSWLKYTDLPRFAVDDGAWAKVFEILEGSFILKLLKVSHPKTLDEQIEMGSDFRLALMVLTRGPRENSVELYQRRLVRAVRWGATTRLFDDAVVWLFNSCASFGCLMVGGIFWYALTLPIWTPLLGLYIRRQAWQTAMCDFLRGEPTSPVKGVTKPKSMLAAEPGSAHD